MKLKNFASYKIEAIDDDGKIIEFQPGEIHDVDEKFEKIAATVEENKTGIYTKEIEVNLSRLLERYPELQVVYPSPIKEPNEVLNGQPDNAINPENIEGELEPLEEIVKKVDVIEGKVEQTVCDICGFRAKSPFGLRVHKRKHNE